MIDIKVKQNCCGCFACLQRCPKKCISIFEDSEGFLYPKVDVDVCIDCGLCEKVCPVLCQSEEKKPLNVYAAKNFNEKIRLESSSGGVFTQLAELIIDNGGVVFGVKWNEHFEAIHTYTESKEELEFFRGSKYVQSQIGATFEQTEIFLKQGRQVLYSGTPCQIAALNLFLGKEYENLLTVDIICHGVPSPGVFRWYLSEELSNIAVKHRCSNIPFSTPTCIPDIPKVSELAKTNGIIIKNIYFRNKSKGWKRFSFVLSLALVNNQTNNDNITNISYSSTLDKNVFLRGFLRDLYLRPSCHYCPAKSGKSRADITLGDYWGIGGTMSELDDDKGISAITVNTIKGENALHAACIELYKVSYENLCLNNSALLYSSPVNEKRILFFESSNDTFFQRIERLCYVPLSLRLKLTVRNIAKIVLTDIYKFFKQ